MGNTRDHFKKIRDTKGTFYAKMGTEKDRHSKDLTEAEDIIPGILQARILEWVATTSSRSSS